MAFLLERFSFLQKFGNRMICPFIFFCQTFVPQAFPFPCKTRKGFARHRKTLGFTMSSQEKGNGCFSLQNLSKAVQNMFRLSEKVVQKTYHSFPLNCCWRLVRYIKHYRPDAFYFHYGLGHFLQGLFLP